MNCIMQISPMQPDVRQHGRTMSPARSVRDVRKLSEKSGDGAPSVWAAWSDQGLSPCACQVLPQISQSSQRRQAVDWRTAPGFCALMLKWRCFDFVADRRVRRSRFCRRIGWALRATRHGDAGYRPCSRPEKVICQLCGLGVVVNADALRRNSWPSVGLALDPRSATSCRAEDLLSRAQSLQRRAFSPLWLVRARSTHTHIPIWLRSR